MATSRAAAFAAAESASEAEALGAAERAASAHIHLRQSERPAWPAHEIVTAKENRPGGKRRARHRWRGSGRKEIRMVDLQSLPSKGQAKNRPAPAHSLNPDSTVPPSQVLTLARRVKALIEKGDRAAEKAEQFYKSAGIHIKEIKEQSDDWETIVREQCGLGRSRAYELIAIADGRTTLEKVRDRSNRSSKISHEKKSAVQRTEPAPAPVTESPKRKAGSPRATGSAEYSPEEHRARMAALDDHDTVEDTIDEVSKRVSCVANTIRRHLDGLTYSDRTRFFATLRDMIDVVELAVKAGVVS